MPSPVRGGTRIAVENGQLALLDGRARTLTLLRADRAVVGRASAGVGPTNGVSDERWLWVVDTRADAVLVYRVRGGLELVRRVALAGRPYAIAVNPRNHKLWVTLTGTNEVAELSANGRPVEERRFPTLRQPDAVAVDTLTNTVTVGGAGGRLQSFRPPKPPAAS